MHVLRDKTIDDKLMYISNNDKQNYLFCRLQSLVETFGHYLSRNNQTQMKKNTKSFNPTNKIKLFF